MNKPFSAQLAPFIVLLVAILGVGSFVVSRDIDTKVKSADDTLLSQTYEDSASGLAMKYPSGWIVGSSESGNLVLQPNDDDETTIEFSIRPESIEQIGITPPAGISTDNIELYRTRDDRLGYTATVTGATASGQTAQSIRYIWLPTENGQTLEVALITDANHLNDYQETLEGVARSVTLSTAEALALTESYSNDLHGIAFQYPKDFEVATQRNLLLIENVNDSTMRVRVYQGTPTSVAATDLELIQVPSELTPRSVVEGKIALEATKGYTVAQPLIDTTLGEMQGATVLLRIAAIDGTLSYSRYSVYEITSERWMAVITEGGADSYSTIAMTTDAMLDSMTFSEPNLALTMGEVVTSANFGASFQHPEDFTLDDTQPGVLQLSSATSPDTTIQMLTRTPANTASDLFSMTETADLTPQLVLESFAPLFVAQSPTYSVSEGPAAATVGAFAGSSVVISEALPSGSVTIRKFAIYEVSPEVWLTVYFIEDQEYYPTLNTAVDEMLTSMTFTAPVTELTQPTAEPTEGVTEPTAEPTETVSGPAEALPLTQEYTSATLGLTFKYPEGYTLDDTLPTAVSVFNPLNQVTQIQFIPDTPVNTATTVFNIQEELPELTPQTALTTFITDITAQNPNFIVVEPVGETTMGSLTGASVLLSQVNPADGAVVMFKIAVVEIDAERWLTVILIENETTFDSLNLTLDEMVAGMTFGGAPSTEPTAEATEAVTEEPTAEATEAVTEEPTAEATEAVTEEPTEEPTVEATEAVTEEPTAEATEAATEGTPTAEPLPLGETATNASIKLTVAVPEGFTSRNLLSFMFVENETQAIRLTIDTVQNVASANLGLQLETLPNNDVAVNLLQSYAEKVADDYDFVSGVTVTDEGNRAFVDLTRGETKTRVYLQALEDGRVLFADATASSDEFDTLASTLSAMLDSATFE